MNEIISHFAWSQNKHNLKCMIWAFEREWPQGNYNYSTIKMGNFVMKVGRKCNAIYFTRSWKTPRIRCSCDRWHNLRMSEPNLAWKWKKIWKQTSTFFDLTSLIWKTHHVMLCKAIFLLFYSFCKYFSEIPRFDKVPICKFKTCSNARSNL